MCNAGRSMFAENAATHPAETTDSKLFINELALSTSHAQETSDPPDVSLAFVLLSTDYFPSIFLR